MFCAKLALVIAKKKGDQVGMGVIVHSFTGSGPRSLQKILRVKVEKSVAPKTADEIYKADYYECELRIIGPKANNQVIPYAGSEHVWAQPKSGTLFVKELAGPLKLATPIKP